MNPLWPKIARRIAHGVGVQPGELVQIRSNIERFDVLQEMLLAVEQAGATPLLETIPVKYLERLLNEASQDYLEKWDKYREGWMKQYDRIVVLQGDIPNFASLPQESFATWLMARHRLTGIEEERRLPFLLVAIPTKLRAQQLGMSLAALEKILLPALAASAEELQNEINRALKLAQGGSTMTIRSGGKYELRMKLGRRPWHNDDGYINQEDRAQGAIVSNLPAGSIYTTVLEDTTEGAILIPKVRQARQVVFHFERGRINRVETSDPAEAGTISAWLDSHSGEPRRISHIGLGLNPYLTREIDWTLVDEHVYGNLFLALGENRYMGGQNESTLNEDFTIPGATLLVDGRTLVENGKVTC